MLFIDRQRTFLQGDDGACFLPGGKSVEYTILTIATAICRYALGGCSSLDSVVAFQKE